MSAKVVESIDLSVEESEGRNVTPLGGNQNSDTSSTFDSHPKYSMMITAMSMKKYSSLGKKKEVLLSFLTVKVSDLEECPSIHNNNERNADDRSAITIVNTTINQ